MSTIDYVPFATGGGALVTSQPTYLTDAPTGVVPGLADPALANKSWRQSSMVAAAVANFISATLGIDVLDDGNLTTLVSNLTAALEVAASSGIAVGMNAPTNLQITPTVGSNNLTIALKGINGSDPSATNPITIPFRHPTIANGDVVVRQLTSALSFTINSTNTMGAATSQPFRLWIVAFDNGGAIALGAINCSTTSRIFPLNESTPQTSESGTTGGSTAGLYYASTSVIAAKSIRILGYMEWSAGLTLAGRWDALPSKVQLFGPGQRKPGDVVQSLYCTTTTPTTSIVSTKVNLSGFSPSPVITPTSAANLIRARLVGNVTNGSGANGTINLFRTTNATVIGTTHGSGTSTAATAMVSPVVCEAVDQPAVTSAVTYGAFVLSGTTTMVWLNSAGVGVGGAGMLTLEEIMG